jgi:hypothetical protein
VANPNLKQLYNTYKRNAKKRGIEFDFPFEWFAELTQQDCYLCGAKPASLYVHDYTQRRYKEPYIYNGIDRADNTLGYIATNVIAACSKCNYAKSVFSIEEFLEHVVKVYEYNFNNDKKQRKV